jgi:hypothetical protein
MSIGIIMTGVIITFMMPTERTEAFRTLAAFQPFAMLGGAAWMLGNLMCPLVIKWVGLGVGLSVWDLTNMLVGWATGRFGWFSVEVATVESEVMNYVGLALATVSLFPFA